MLLAYLINSVIVAIAVLVHFEALYHLSNIIPRLHIRHRFRVLFGICGAMIAHVVEIWLFAFGYYFLIKWGQFGTLHGEFSNTLLDCVYFSFVAYTSLGLGDIYPTGNLRFLMGLEVLTGLVLITWSASFLFIEMQKFWKD
ncbi:MAG: ion channel [Gammaproteobacteria bacterium]